MPLSKCEKFIFLNSKLFGRDLIPTKNVGTYDLNLQIHFNRSLKTKKFKGVFKKEKIESHECFRPYVYFKGQKDVLLRSVATVKIIIVLWD